MSFQFKRNQSLLISLFLYTVDGIKERSQAGVFVLTVQFVCGLSAAEQNFF
jgi:hypothetical protein